MSTPLATVEQLSDHLHKTLDSAALAAEQAVNAASAAIRSYTRQTLTLVEDDEVVLRGTWRDQLDLPEVPVVEVSDITGVDVGVLVASSWTLVGSGVHRSGGWLGPGVALSVTYTHGFATIPDDLVAVCLALAARTFDNPRALASEGYEGYSTTPHLYPLELSRTEQAILDLYRRRTM